MHFLNWILDQQEEPGNLGVFSKVIWQDINNGCGARFTSPIEWRIHFNKKHPTKADTLNGLLAAAYVQYVNSITPDKE